MENLNKKYIKHRFYELLSALNNGDFHCSDCHEVYVLKDKTIAVCPSCNHEIDLLVHAVQDVENGIIPLCCLQEELD